MEAAIYIIYISIYLPVDPSLSEILSVGMTWQEANWGDFRSPTRGLFTPPPCEEDSVGIPPALPGPEPIFKGDPLSANKLWAYLSQKKKNAGASSCSQTWEAGGATSGP